MNKNLLQQDYRVKIIYNYMVDRGMYTEIDKAKGIYLHPNRSDIAIANVSTGRLYTTDELVENIRKQKGIDKVFIYQSFRGYYNPDDNTTYTFEELLGMKLPVYAVIYDRVSYREFITDCKELEILNLLDLVERLNKRIELLENAIKLSNQL